MLDSLFYPRSTAVVGAAREPHKVGHSILRNLMGSGYTGRIFPVNPKASEILGLKCHPDLASVPGEVDLAVIAVPAAYVQEVIEDCGKKGVPAAVVISAGFKETGEEGRKLEARLVKRAGELGIRVLGPNCLGLINTSTGLNASFAQAMPAAGSIAFFSQSGALCTAILDWSLTRGIGFSKFVSLGNKADVSETDMVDYLSRDEGTRVVLGYIEGVGDGRKFMETAARTVKNTPLIIAKAGGTDAGARAASSHTGTLAGSERAFEAAFRQSGVLRASTIEELFNFALAFSMCAVPEGPRLAVVTNAGGPGIIAADAVERSDVLMAEFTPETVAGLKRGLPPSAGFFNPVDIIGDADAGRYALALAAVLDDPNVDGALVVLTPQAMTEVEKTAKVIIDARSASGKPVLASFMGGPGVKNGVEMLNAAGVAVYAYPEDAVKSFEALVRYAGVRKRPKPVHTRFDAQSGAVRAVIDAARISGEKRLGEKQVREVLAAYGFRTPREALAFTSAEAVEAARGIGYPVVMKIASPDIIHKTDVGGVRVGLSGDREVEDAFLEITSNARRIMPRAMVLGCTVQEMVEGGREVILGLSFDPQFGPLLMFGMGGIYVEALQDVSFRLAPVGVSEADDMMREIKMYRVLKGLRGESPSDLGAARECILRLSQLAVDFPEIVEMDINPLVVLGEGEGAVAIDARITLS